MTTSAYDNAPAKTEGDHDRPGPARIMRRLAQLGLLSSEAGALTRLYLSPEHGAATRLVAGWMAAAGMTVGIDAIGNVVGRYPGSTPQAKTLMLGSHIDTVRDAGRYDGCLGVVVAIDAVAMLAAKGERLPFAIEVVAFGDEEGVRFPEALAGSRSVAGIFEASALDTIDTDGISLRAALVAFGCDPAGIPALARRKADVIGYIEVHIEQGPRLEAEDVPVGVVTAIAGASRLEVHVTGTAGHAGTVPMRLRRDAFAAFAAMAVHLEQVAMAAPEVVATIGQVEVQPGAVNVIPAHVRFTVDVRSPSDAIRIAALERLHKGFADIAAARGVAVSARQFYEEPAAPCAPAFRAVLGRAIAARGVRLVELPSGAGHDGLAMISLCPIGMLFVRCAGGISHNPAEAVDPPDVGIALDVLIDFLRTLDPARSA